MSAIGVAKQPLHLVNRLAFGPRPGDLETVARLKPQAWLAQQLHPESLPEPPALTEAIAQLDTLRMTPPELFAQFGPPMAVMGVKPDPAVVKAARRAARVVVQQAMAARVYRAVLETRQLREVMVAFWFNHFNIFADKGLDYLWVGAFEEDAIRPHVFGRFRDLLGATARHPAMLFYLDNWQNTAPDAPGARRRFEGINENYARELMELHTLGVNGGYTQADVTALAHILTGWGIVRRENPARPNFARRQQRLAAMGAVRTREGFFFDPTRHDFADKVWLGRTIHGSGIEEGEKALDVLAQSPATAHHLSFKLCQYFVADNPPADLVGRLAQRYLETDGSIREVLLGLFASSEFWDLGHYANKFKSPYEFVISAVRATGLPVRNVQPLIGTMAMLGMPLYGCQTPDGYKNTQDAWLNPDAMMMRLSFAAALGAGRLPIDRPPTDFMTDNPRHPPRALLERTGMAADDGIAAEATPDPIELAMTVGDMFSARTTAAVEAAPNNLRAALILGSPEFMMR